MSTFAQWRSPSRRVESGSPGDTPRKYDIRVIDQFHAYCQAVARTVRHRDEAHQRSYTATKRSILGILAAGSLLFYYLAERLALAISQF